MTVSIDTRPDHAMKLCQSDRLAQLVHRFKSMSRSSLIDAAVAPSTANSGRSSRVRRSWIAIPIVIALLLGALVWLGRAGGRTGATPADGPAERGDDSAKPARDADGNR
jgi:hypothetical protein